MAEGEPGSCCEAGRVLPKFFHSLWDDPGGAVAKEELLALGLSPDYSQALVWHMRPRLHVAPRVPVL